MKKVFTAVAFLGLCALPALAQGSAFTLYGAYTDPKDGGNAFGGGLGFEWGILQIRGTYFDDVKAKDFENSGCPPVCVFGHPKISDIPVEVGLKFRFPSDVVTPFLGGGVGYHFLRLSNNNALDANGNRLHDEINDEVGWYAMLGADFMTSSNFGIFVEGNYRWIRGTVKSRGNQIIGVRDRVDLQLGGPGANVGLVWRFQ
jgi:opacity protein-like surface antigen